MSSRPRNVPKPDRSKRADVYPVTRQDQLRETVSTRRHDILDQISATGPMSVRELAQMLKLTPSSLYYHVERLCEVGLLREVGERQETTKPEKVYDTPARRLSMFEALQKARNAPIMTEIVGSICTQAHKDFAASFEASHRDSASAERNVRFFRLVGRPDAAARREINKHLDAIDRIMAASAAQDEPRVSLMWVVAPLPEDN